MKTYDKAVEWMGVVLDIGKANGVYLNGFKLYKILYDANEIIKKKTGMALFREEVTIINNAWLRYESIKEKMRGLVGVWPIYTYDPGNIDVDLIQLNAIRKAMGLPVVRADLEEENEE